MATATGSAALAAFDYLTGARLSDRFKDAFRLALAMVITYGVAMGMDWNKPFWAALSVIFCSLATAGESINKGIDRIKGTAVAAAAALLIITLFPQDRWLFMMAISLFIAVCSYRMTGPTPRRDIWFNAGFSLPIIAILGEMGGSLAPATFEMAVLRVQQTALGVVVYSLVAVLVWPRRGDTDFIDTVLGIARTQRALFVGYLGKLTGEQGTSTLDESLAGVAKQLPLLVGKLEGAAYDSPEVQAAAGTWRRHISKLRSLHMAFERWHSGFEELEGLDLRRYMPDWERCVAEVDYCLQGVESCLAGENVPRRPLSMDLSIDGQTLRELPHFQRAAVVACRDRLHSIASLAAALFDSAAKIQSGELQSAEPMAVAGSNTIWTIDLDRLSTTIRQTTALWLCFLIVIYVPSVPVAVGFVALTNAFSMAFGQLPHVPATVLLKPVLLGALLGGLLYMGVMPHLSGFGEFGGMLFAVTFAVAYVFNDPRAALVKGMLLTMTVIIISAQNQQTYSFLVFGNWSMVGVMFVAVMIIAWHVPISFRAEHRFRAQVRRYLRSVAFLLADLAGRRESGPRYLRRWQRSFHLHELTVLPPRVRTWSAALPPTALGNTPPGQLEKLLNGMQLFSYRMQDFLEAFPEAMETTRPGEVQSQGEATRASLREIFATLASDPAALDEQRCQDLLESAESRLAQRVDEALRAADMDRGEGQRIYRLLSAYRGLLGAFGDITRGLSRIDWARLREARF